MERIYPFLGGPCAGLHVVEVADAPPRTKIIKKNLYQLHLVSIQNLEDSDRFQEYIYVWIKLGTPQSAWEMISQLVGMMQPDDIKQKKEETYSEIGEEKLDLLQSLQRLSEDKNES